MTPVPHPGMCVSHLKQKRSSVMYSWRRLMLSKSLWRIVCPVGIFLALVLAIVMALLTWHLLTTAYLNNSNDRMNRTCPPDPCSSTTRTTTTNSVQNNTLMTTITSTSTTNPISNLSSTTSTSAISNRTKRTYKESCTHLFDCYTEYGLLCEFGWKSSKNCLCEGSHYWSIQQNKCLRKGEVNEPCDIDYQCHREIGLVCDMPPDVSRKICVCAASIYWAKDSNCGQTSVRRIVDCVNENYATTCLVLDVNNLYHMVTIRSIMEKEFSFDWFLVDNRILSDLPQLSCALNNGTKYCFGLNPSTSQRSLELAQFTRKGFHSVETMGGNNRGIAFGLTNVNSVAVFVRNAQNTLYRRVIADDEILAPHDVALSTTGDPICYIHEPSPTRPTYCFARNSANGITEYVEQSANTWRATVLGNRTDRVRDEISPVCSYIGPIRRYCFAIFENGQIYRIVFNAGAWTSWQSIGSRQFLTQPLFLTSNRTSCFLLAIDMNNNLQLSTNVNCDQSDSFSEWIPISNTLKFKQMDKSFRLRDENIGVLGIDSQNQAYYIYLDPTTHRFSSPRPAFTIKSEQFRV